MSRWFRKKDKDVKKGSGGKHEPRDHDPQLTGVYRPPSIGSLETKEENGHPSSASPTSNELSQPISSLRAVSTSPKHGDPGISRESSRSSVKATTEMFESLSKSQSASPDRSLKGSMSPEKVSISTSGRLSLTPTRDPLRSSIRNRQSGLSISSQGSLTQVTQSTPNNINNLEASYTSRVVLDTSFELKLEVGKEKEFPHVKLKLPPLQTSRVRHRAVTSAKNPVVGGFGFNLRKAFQPDPDNPEKPLLVHLVEPRPNYTGPLMTGDRILEVNGENVENSPHERVVELIKRSGEVVEMKVASVPELMELNERGVFDDMGMPARMTTDSITRKSVRPGTGTLRKQAAQRRQKANFQAKSESQVHSEKNMLKQDRVWVVHKDGFSLGVVDNEAASKPSSLATHVSVVRSHGKKIKLIDTDDVVEVEEEDIEKANPSSLDRVEDLIELVHINESSVLHVLRQRYGSSLIHTFAGRHLLVINPLRPLSLYSDRVKEMFRGCRREDMPPHIFAAGQQAYHKMLQSNTDQSLVLMGLSGSGKTFNARYLLQYLATTGQVENGPVTCSKMDAVQLLLHTFTSAETFLNPQATRCSCLYSLEFDTAGSLTAASVRTFLLEKTRIAVHPEGEGSFNILYKLIAGADETLRKELLLDVHPGTDEANHYVEPYKEPQQVDSAACVWDLIQNCLTMLNVTPDEALGLWSLLAAIFHLGYAGVKQGSSRVSDRFINPAAAQRAASLLGIHHEELAKDIFNPPRGTSSRLSSFLSSSMSPSPTVSDTSSINLSIGSFNISPGTARANRSFSLDAFVMGLYEYALSALVLLINRSLHPSSQQSKGKFFIHVLDTPGFQHRELAGCTEGSSFDDLCMNYTRERLQMLFHDSSFTMEQDRYIQDDIDWTFSEIVMSPLSIIDVIDKHIPQRRNQGILQGLSDFNDRPGILWILEEESTFPGSNDTTFLERIQTVHGEPDDFGDTTVKVDLERGRFTILHCQRSLPVEYDISGWRQRAREHPSTRVVGQVLAESKRKAVSCLFQGRGVASLSTSSSAISPLTSEASSSLRVGRTLSFSNPTAGIKKSSICLRTKFQLDFLIDIMRKTEQWYIHCLLCQPPHNLPGAVLPPDTTEQKENAPYGHIDVPLVRAQLRRGDIIPAARIYKQGYPDHMMYPAFRRRYTSLLQPEEKECLPGNDKDAVEFIVSGLELERNSYKLGLSQVFFRAGYLSILERQVEEKIHDFLVKFQAHIRGYLGRKLREKLELQHAAAHVIQRNVFQADIINNWPWWKLFQKVKPLLQVWKAEKEVKEKDSQIETLKSKYESIEGERDVLKESELILNQKMADLTAQLQEAQETAQHATELLEQEQMEKRQLLEQNQEMTLSEQELLKRNEQLQWQIAELTILSNIKKSEGIGRSGDREGGNERSEESEVLEKYWETRRELEMLRQRISTERDDEIDRLQHSKKGLEKRLADSEAEVDDLRRNLTQVRKKASKFSSELNDLKLLLESQQARNEELEKKQRKFDADISVAMEGGNKEKLEKERLEREKKMLEIENSDLESRYKKLQEAHRQLENEKSEMEAEFIKRGGSSDAESEIALLKQMKKDLENKVEELEDEVDELNIKMDSLQQSKTRLEVAQKSLREQHQKELEGREEDLEQVKSTMNKKLKSMEQQLEEEHENKQQAIRAKREIEREFHELQSRMTGDPEMERKLKKQVKKYKALLKDAQDELEHERETKSNASALRSLRTQLEDFEMREVAATKAQKRLQSEMDDLQAQFDEASRIKMELESHISELQREKADLESRLEEEQDEVEQLVAKQRQNISQLGNVQHQLTEANYKIEELEESKHTLETKVAKLQQRVSDLESEDTKQEKEASELKVRELEQKLDLEKSTIKRQEALVSRLRGQLERLQNEKAEDSSSKTSEAMKRLQKQIRDLREELQEAEKREQEQNKKRRAAETQLSEMEVQVQTATADLKYAQKRIESLQGALTAEGVGSDYDDEEDDEESSPRHINQAKTKNKKNVNHAFDDSSDGSYHIGEFADSSSDEDMARMAARKKQREKERIDLKEDASDEDKYLSKKKNGEKERKTVADDVDSDFEYKPRKKRDWSDEDEGKKPTKSKNYDEDDDITPKRKYNWRELLSDNEEDEKKGNKESKKASRKQFDLSDDDIDLPSNRKPPRKYSNDEELSRVRSSRFSSDEEDSKTNNRRRPKGKFEDDEDKKPSWKSKYDFSDDSTEDKPIRKTISKSKVEISSDEDYQPRKTTAYKKALKDDDLEEEVGARGRKDIGDSSRPRTKKAWEISSDEEEDYKPRPRNTKLTSLLSDEDDDIPVSRTTKRHTDFISDEDDNLPILKHAPKRGDKPSEKKKSEESSPSRKDSVKFDVMDEENKSFESSRKRRERRRSRLSNTGTSPEDSPKRTAQK